MATIEQHDEMLILETNQAEQVVVEAAMRAIGAKRDEVGGGLVLFLVDDSVILRSREVISPRTH